MRMLHRYLFVSLCFLLPAAALAATPAPAIIAHRGGTADAPENTLVAISQALQHGADAVWITLQQAKDGAIVLYRPSDLRALTDKQGLVSAYSAEELAQADAGWAFGKDGNHPFRGKHIGIPTLEQALTAFPQTTFYLDIKSPDSDPAKFAAALLATLEKNHSLERTRVYSTDAKYLQALPPQIKRFASRDETRDLLANITMAHQCDVTASPNGPRWYGLEMKRQVEVVEKYTLGEARSKALLVWDKEAVDCFRAKGPAHIILFGINSPQDYQQALALGVDGVMVDSPLQAEKFRKAR